MNSAALHVEGFLAFCRVDVMFFHTWLYCMIIFSLQVIMLFNVMWPGALPSACVLSCVTVSCRQLIAWLAGTLICLDGGKKSKLRKGHYSYLGFLTKFLTLIQTLVFTCVLVVCWEFIKLDIEPDKIGKNIYFYRKCFLRGRRYLYQHTQ